MSNNRFDYVLLLTMIAVLLGMVVKLMIDLTNSETLWREHLASLQPAHTAIVDSLIKKHDRISPSVDSNEIVLPDIYIFEGAKFPRKH